MKIKNWNTAPVVTVCLQHHHYHHFTLLINPTFGKITFIYLFQNHIQPLFLYFMHSIWSITIFYTMWKTRKFHKSEK